jgi:hypothetical protein
LSKLNKHEILHKPNPREEFFGKLDSLRELLDGGLRVSKEDKQTSNDSKLSFTFNSDGSFSRESSSVIQEEQVNGWHKIVIKGEGPN